MSPSRSGERWSGPAGAMAEQIELAVAAARDTDADGFATAIGFLARMDEAQVVVVLGTLTRELIEQTHPDGLDTDDAQQALDSCVRFATPWYVDVDSDALIVALTGAFGVSDPEAQPPGLQRKILPHGVLLVTDLLVTHRRQLRPFLDSALAELRRAQSIELP